MGKSSVWESAHVHFGALAQFCPIERVWTHFLSLNQVNLLNLQRQLLISQFNYEIGTSSVWERAHVPLPPQILPNWTKTFPILIGLMLTYKHNLYFLV